MKLWHKGKESDKAVERFTVGDDWWRDRQLVYYDCIASKAHARMLHKIGLLSEQERDDLLQGLDEIIRLDEQGTFEIKLSDEDCHTAIENWLTGKYGETGKKIHTGRSRNDQVLTALRLLYRDAIDAIDEQAQQLAAAFKGLQKRHGKTAIPGLTHTRKAMPSSVKMWAGAFIDALADDRELLKSVRRIVNQSPLGTAAGYGVPLLLDREFTAKELGFDRVQKNPVYTQLSRGKFESMLLSALSQILLVLNRCAADLILFSVPEWGFFKMPEKYATGSSIMPQKVNPDVLELVRASYHRLLGFETQLKTTTANLISGYHRDLQLTKAPVLKSLETTRDALQIMTGLVAELKVDESAAKKQMTDELFATDKVYELVQKGVSFREAYRRVAKELFGGE